MIGDHRGNIKPWALFDADPKEKLHKIKALPSLFYVLGLQFVVLWNYLGHCSGVTNRILCWLSVNKLTIPPQEKQALQNLELSLHTLKWLINKILKLKKIYIQKLKIY